MRRAWGVGVFLLAALSMVGGAARAQSKGEVGKYDYYLLTLSWSPEFCSIQGTGQECKAHPGFIVHGLWPQNFDGTYPVFCDKGRPGPAHPEQNMDITPDASLLAHEWAKHGTCTTLGPDAFFAMERRAFRSVKIPAFFLRVDHEVAVKTEEIVTMFDESNPGFPAGSVAVSCVKGRLSAVEVCVAKDGLKPIACGRVEACGEESVRVVPPVAK
ncbi:MAG: ribonuclease T2 [Acidobacteriaceae bacterium]|jgi:ribonuclease T2